MGRTKETTPTRSPGLLKGKPVRAIDETVPGKGMESMPSYGDKVVLTAADAKHTGIRELGLSTVPKRRESLSP